jgi:hypothetical protein
MSSRTGGLLGVSFITILWHTSSGNIRVTQDRTYDRKPAVSPAP